MNKYTPVAIILALVGAVGFFYVAKASLPFLLDHWVTVLVTLIIAVGYGVYYLLTFPGPLD
jgi:hypothetical protein